MAKENEQIQWFASIDRDGAIIRTQQEFISSQIIIRVIVNPWFIKATADLGNNEAQKALAVIERLKTDNKEPNQLKEVNISGWLAGRSRNLLKDLGLNLPHPSHNLKIEVCGVNTDMSNIALVYVLRKAGYTAGFNKNASCAGRTEPPQMVIRQILDEFPDFFD